MTLDHWDWTLVSVWAVLLRSLWLFWTLERRHKEES